MASTQKAYLNPDAGPTEKERHYFSAADLDEFFRTCPPELVPQRFLRMIQGMFIAVEQRLNKRLHGDTFEFCLAVEDYRRGCRYKSDRTVRYNLRPAVKRGLLEIAHRDQDGNTHHIWIRPRTARDRGLYRRVTTYRLSLSVLLKWREMHQGRTAEVTPIRKPAQPTPPPLPPAPAAPLPARKVAEETSLEVFPDRQRSRLRRRMQAILRESERRPSSVGNITFLSLVRQACDDELIDFEIAWPFVEKLWWRNEEGWRKRLRRGEEGEPEGKS